MRRLCQFSAVLLLPVLLLLCGYGPALFCVLTIWLCHELGHLLAALLLHLPIQGLSPTLSGGLRILMPALPDRRELLLALAGPAANFMFALLLHIAGRFPALADGSLLLGLSSLLPFLPLDGGRVLRVLLLRRKGWWQLSCLLSAGGEFFGLLLLPVVFFLSGGWLVSLWGIGLFYLCLRSRRSVQSAYLYYLLALRRRWRENPALPLQRTLAQGKQRALTAAANFSPAFRCRFLFWERSCRRTVALEGEAVLEAMLYGRWYASLEALWREK